MTSLKLALAAFRATRKTGIPADCMPSDAPATEEYSYAWGGVVWCIRCERGRYVYSWTHPANQDAATLEEAERLLFDMAFEGSSPTKRGA
jgi:hypothetical protein